MFGERQPAHRQIVVQLCGGVVRVAGWRAQLSILRPEEKGVPSALVVW